MLVADDEPQLLRALRINLRARHYDVETAPNGAAALAAAARCPPDLVILDLGLPDLDGVHVIEGLRGWTRVPIIVLSGRADPAGKADALDAGADDYVTKPFHMDELRARVRSALRRSVGGTEVASFTLGHHVIDLAARTITPAEDVSGSSAGSAATAGGAPAGSAATAGGAPAGSAATTGGIPAGSGATTGGSSAGSAATAGGAPSGSEAAASDTRPGPVRLTPTEWGVLEILLRNAGKLVPARQLLSGVGAQIPA